MTRALRATAERWPLARPFAIARGVKTAADVVVAEIAEGGVTGRGECVPYPRYGETVEGVKAAVEAQAEAVAGGLGRHELLGAMPAGAARNAIDAALWDLEAKASGRRAWDLAGLDAPTPTPTAVTVSLDAPERMAEAAAALGDCPLIKIKVGRDDVVARVLAVRGAAPAARLVVDANEGWDAGVLAAVAEDLAGLGVEMIEQPLPAGSDAALAGFDSPVALCADESCHGIDDLDGLAGRYRVVNVKLDKAGGLTAALALAAAARARGFEVMLGCMVCTSLAVAPATLLSAEARLVDLDGPLWLAEDRRPPIRFDGHRVHAPEPELWG